MAVNVVHLGDRDIAVDKDGFLVDLTDWSMAVAKALAEREGMVLTPAHEDILNLLRRFYAQFQLSPATRPLVKYVALHLGADTGNSAYLNHLFKGTPAKLAAKLAGLPKPANCI
jgi:tRNA 2-thiouridine synthesizing protein E